jgi:hypothetical protein
MGGVHWRKLTNDREGKLSVDFVPKKCTVLTLFANFEAKRARNHKKQNKKRF